MMDQNLGLHLEKKQCLSDKCHPMISSMEAGGGRCLYDLINPNHLVQSVVPERYSINTWWVKWL